MSNIKELINEINDSGEYKVDQTNKIIYQKINLGWFVYCKYWTKKDLERFINTKLKFKDGGFINALNSTQYKLRNKIIW